MLLVVLGAGVLLHPAGRAHAVECSGLDSGFLRSAHQSNLAEIAAGNLALRRATTLDVKRHGRLFVNDHGRLDAEVRRLAARLSVTLPDRPSASQQEQVARLSAKRGPAFDAAWLEQEIRMHRESVEAAECEVEHGHNAQVRTVARHAVPVLRTHLAILQETAGRRIPDAVEAGGGGQSRGEPARSAPLGLGLLGVGVILATGALLIFPRRRKV